MNDLATDKQLKLMDKMNLPYDIRRTTKYEASAMIDKAMRDGDYSQGGIQPSREKYPNSWGAVPPVNTQNLIVAQVAVKCAVDLITGHENSSKLNLDELTKHIYNLIKEVGKNG